MEIWNGDILLAALANVLRVYADKRLMDEFFGGEDRLCRKLLYVFFWAEHTLVFCLWANPALSMVSNFIGLFLPVLFYKAGISRKVLVTTLVYGMNAAVDGMVLFVFTEYLYGRPLNAMYAGLTGLIIFLLAIVLEKTIRMENHTDLPVKHVIVLALIPAVSIGMLLCLLQKLPATKTAIIVVASGILLINILVFYFYHSLVQLYGEKQETEMLQRMTEAYASQIAVMQESQERVRALRHDLRHHILELSGMARRQDCREMEEYLKNMEQFMLNPKEHVSTGDQRIDSLLNYLLQQADRLLEHTEVRIDIPGDSCFGSFTVTAVLGNLVENAIREAAKSREKRMELRLKAKKGLLLIDVRNSYEGPRVPEGDRLLTTQTDGAAHGIGLENVKKVVEANNGEWDIRYTEEWFEARVLLYVSNIK